jgi:3-phosphoshikimate 1-carboxyvinyltransferase
LYGLQNLVNKESDRVVAFQREAYKLNIKTDFCDCSKLKIFDFSQIKYSSRAMNTYNDHRIAMTFAPLSLLTGKIKIDNPEVVSKSYPTFWRNLEQLGFVIRKI